MLIAAVPYRCRFPERGRKIIILLLMTIILSSCMLIAVGRDDPLLENLQKVFDPVDDNLQRFVSRLEGPIPADDPQLLQYVRENYLISPSKKPYNLEENSNNEWALEYNKYRLGAYSWVFLNDLITTLFKDEPPGFFVEAGAFDGEYLSNTLDLERYKGWTGLLVEVDSQLFGRLRKKNRKAWISNSCLATSLYPHQTTLVVFTNHRNPQESFALISRASNVLETSKELPLRLQKTGFPLYQHSQCFPLQTLLYAINVTHVDFVSLDVEGVEMEVLQSFFGGNVTVDVWIVEHAHPGRFQGETEIVHKEFIHWFQSKGYTLYTFNFGLLPDYAFIRNGSKIYERAFASRPPIYRRSY